MHIVSPITLKKKKKKVNSGAKEMGNPSSSIETASMEIGLIINPEAVQGTAMTQTGHTEMSILEAKKTVIAIFFNSLLHFCHLHCVRIGVCFPFHFG